ncbi:non-ribosomal peptide synthetase [Streptomyces viridifaciens]|uniref:non-ribosomal peptide synthetase n=1 Tax=Kitasatospora aureofaciens TaxID=1894 RepID=UPI00092C3FC3|nr:amino acid adenylation domain-containing protein [Streptomyces viridifaciens]UKZ09419.1 non-ribosomal peptide synthetase [Streptomyces viridifaciens]
MLESPSTTESDPRQGWTLASRFSAVAAASPEATAVRSEAGDLRYAELDAAADALAARLHGRGVRRGDRVGVLLERSPRLIVALLGILKAGAAYVAVDPGDPVARLRTVLGDAEVALVVTDDPQRAGVDGEFPSLDIQDTRGAGACAPTVEQTPEDLAYVAYTSGSTGRPKGVCVPHRAVLRLVLDAAFLGARTDDVFLQLAPVAFDASTLEIWGALLNGGCLALAPAGRLGPAEIVKTVRDTGTTVLFLTTALFHQAVEAGLSDLPALRALYTGGEVLSAELVDRAAAALPGTLLSAAYGPTENTTFTSTHPVREPLGARGVPIGGPIDGTGMVVLDERLDPVPDGTVGRLFVNGAGLAHGYLGLPGLTADRFLPDPYASTPGARMYDTGDLALRAPDGAFEFAGRADGQLKVNGVRIESDDIEARLRRHPDVQDAAVVLQDHGPGDRRLVAFYSGPYAVSSVELRRGLAEDLPATMIPSALVWVDRLPLKANGKVDRAALAARRGRTRPDGEVPYRAPGDRIERRLTVLWQEILDVEPVGVDDDFFDLGGHSLTASRITREITAEFGAVIRARAFYLNPTVAGLAEHIRTQRSEPATDARSVPAAAQPPAVAPASSAAQAPAAPGAAQ